MTKVFSCYAENGMFTVYMNSGMTEGKMVVTCVKDNVPVSTVLGSVDMFASDDEHIQWVSKRVKERMGAKGIASIRRMK